MKKYLNVMMQCPLFAGISEQNLLTMTSCLGSRVARFEKGETIFAEGEPAWQMGLILSGAAQIVKEDFYGNRTIVARIESAEMFGESFACAQLEAIPVSVVAAETSVIMLMDCQRLLTTCSHSCEFHNRLIFNLLKVVATKNLIFNQKMEILSKRTTREKLMTYLNLQAKHHGHNSFTVPYDRQELADYLQVDRSGLSAEISKLRREGVLECEKNRFILK
jgi:CRP-like cAMP-binding protein